MASKKTTHLDRELISLREIAELWHCDRTTVARILNRAGVKPYILTHRRNGTKRYARDDIEAFMASCLKNKNLSCVF